MGLPLYVVELSAMVRAREPFDLLDRYVGLAIVDAECRSTADIAAFLGLTEAMVDRTLRFLAEIGHLQGEGGTLSLTELGLSAARDDQRYTPKEDRLKLYFDGVRCAPLPSAYYSNGVRVLTRSEALAQREFALLDHLTAFRTNTVAELAARADRGDFNLPDEHEDLKTLEIAEAFLPCYVIRAQTPTGPRLLVYCGAAENDDSHLESIISSWPALDHVLGHSDIGDPREQFGDWLRKRNLSPRNLTWIDHQVPRLTLNANHYPRDEAPSRENGTFPLHQLGSYSVLPRGHVLQLWCNDPKTRRQAALERALTYATSARRRTADDVTELLGTVSQQLELRPALTIDDLRTYARRTGQGDLHLR
ncbi:hypothetical protein KGA66_28115 [Actinocrinis puniceicyclus]|uniref:Uncharacterized protein n=1 Tax=Actinocrinis puniceicyclus TaxID=977794 RepID=A0A8J7WW10_9ACTN|nr:hypothetical protein [Actinocrinis puniceicyclus]MBS2966932.1 hypothetical protein [Actinocrinis puniceicyclus]